MLLFSSILMGVKSKALTRQATELEREVGKVEEKISEIQQTLPALRRTTESIINQEEVRYASVEETTIWALKMASQPYHRTGLKRASSTLETRPPLGMDIPWVLRQADHYIHPVFVPHQIRIDLEGPLSLMDSYLEELDRIIPEMVITKLNISATETEKKYQGYVLVAFPSALHAEDIELLSQFAGQTKE
jgi:hypothetical protein